MSSPRPAVLSIAASDPTGGAGTQADLLTLASLGCHPLSVITALTVQDTAGVHGVLPIEPDWILRQARIVLADIAPAAFKIGVLGSARAVAAVAELLAEHPRTAVVLDPVLASGRGDPLSDSETVQALRTMLLPRVTIATPNSGEARRLALAHADAALPACAEALTGLGCRYVLVTGAHEPGERVTNTLYDARGAVRADHWPRLEGDYHGSGCTLASALAAMLARGIAVPEAAFAAEEYTWNALRAGYRAGRGQRIPDRFFGTP